MVINRKFYKLIINSKNMANEERKYTFRQRWFPNFDDADDLARDIAERFSTDKSLELLGRWARSILVGSVIGGLLAWTTFQGIGNNIVYSEGTRAGVVNKISRKGLIWKKYEGQLALEGVIAGQASIANVWNFSIDETGARGENPYELATELEKYMNTGQKIRVSYVEQLASWPWRSTNTYLVQKVEPTN